MFDFIKNNQLIICPNSYKKVILKYLSDQKLIFNIKFMTIEEFNRKRRFDYDINTIHYLVKKGMKVENAITFLNNLLYIEDKDYANEKLNYLVRMKQELDKKNLLIYDKLFSKTLERRDLIVYGYGNLDKWQLSLLPQCQIIDYSIKKESFLIYHIPKISDEVEFVFQKIVDLLKQGISLDKICLMNVDIEYYPILKRYAKFYNIPIDIPCNDSLMGTMIGKAFYQMVMDNKSREEIKEYLDKYSNSKIHSILINLLNTYASFNISDIHELIKYELLNTKLPSIMYENTIKIKNIFDYIGDDDYVFLMGFNNSSIPKTTFDIDYITDNIKDLVNLPKTEEVNLLSKENTLNYLKNINNLIISYKDRSPFNEYYPSILLDEMTYKLEEYQRKMNYSHQANELLYTEYLDDLVKYGIQNKNLPLLYQNYQENNYLKYDNSFDKIDELKLIKFLKDELTLSYSDIDNYYKCSFKYYINSILKLDIYEESFSIFIGKLFHDVLRHMNDLDFNLDKRYEEYLKKRDLTDKEKFFVDKLKKELVFIIETIKKHQFITGFNKMLYEEKIDIVLKKSPYVHFKGFVDKIMYKEQDNQNLVSIIDYKTGNPDIRIENLEFGLSMQLPVYLYLVENSGLLKNMQFTGFYLQHILDIDIKKDKKSFEEQKYNNLKLIGYSSDNLTRLAAFDDTFENSEMIKGMKKTKAGTLACTAKVLTDREIDDIIKLTHQKIMEAMDNILKADFAINPKILKGKNISCKYCDYRDICYVKEKNKVYLTKDAELDEENDDEIYDNE